MADNIQCNENTTPGAVLATDECTVNSVANVHVPWTKLGFGTHDSFTPVTTGAGLPIQDGGGSISIDDNGASLTVDNAALAVTGGGAEASALRVTLANDSTGVLSIDDNGSSISIDDGGNTITVDGTVAISGNVTVNAHAVTNAGTFVVQVNGDALTALQTLDNIVLAEDAGHNSGDPGVMMLGVRSDSDASLAATDLDYVPMQFDANGYLKVHIKAGAGSGGASAVDGAAFAADTDSGTPMMGFVSTDAVNSNDVGVVRMLANRQLAVTLHDSSGVEVAVGGGTQYDEDTAHSSGDKVTMAGVVRADSAASPAGSDGDRSCLITDSTGRLWCNVSNTLNVNSHAVTNAGTFAVQAAQSGAYNITDVSGTVSLPTGASTEAKQDDVISGIGDLDALLTTIDGDTSSLAGCVGGSELQVDIVGAIPAGNNNIGDVDVASVVPGTGAASLGKAIDSVAGSTDTGVAILAVRDDALSSLGPAEGDWVPIRVNSQGAVHVTGGGGGTEYTEGDTDASITGSAILWEDAGNALATVSASTPLPVEIIAGAGSGGTASDDDADFTAGTTAGTPAMGVYESSPTSVTDGDMGIIGITQSRQARVAVEASALPSGASTSANQSTIIGHLDGVEGLLTTIDADTGNIVTSVQLIDDAIVADDAAFTPATTRVMMAGFTFDDNTPDSVNEGDAGAARMSANRCIYVNLRDNAGNERGLNIDGSGFLTANINGTVTVGSHAVTNAGTFPVQVDGAALTALQLIDNPVFVDDAAFTPGTSSVFAIGMQADETATDSVDEGDAGCPRMTLDRKQIVTAQPHTTGGCSNYSALSTAAVLTAEIKGSAGQVFSIECFNNGANEVFVRLYNQTGAPGSGDGANIIWRGMVPGNAAGAGFVISWPMGKTCATGIGIRASAGIADNNTGSLTADEVQFNVSYK